MKIMSQKQSHYLRKSLHELDKTSQTLTSLKCQDIADYIISYLQILEKFILMLLNTNEKQSNISKLNYCYCYFNTIKWNLEEQNNVNDILLGIGRSIIKKIQNCLSILKRWKCDKNKDNRSTTKSKIRLNPMNLNSILYKRSKRLNKMPKSHISNSSSIDSLNDIINLFYKDIFSLDKTDVSIDNIDIQHTIDELYLQTKSVISDNRLQNNDILREINTIFGLDSGIGLLTENGSRNTVFTSNSSNMDFPEVAPPSQTGQVFDRDLSDNERRSHRVSIKPLAQLWFGDCKMNGDNVDNFSSNCEQLLNSNNFDFDMALFADELLISDINYQRSRTSADSDIDEGFCGSNSSDSEMEVIYKKSDHSTSYCGDCDNNSSNSKSSRSDRNSVILDTTKTQSVVCEVNRSNKDDGSDSDGGTELLQSVNDTLDRFNAIMQDSMISRSEIQQLHLPAVAEAPFNRLLLNIVEEQRRDPHPTDREQKLQQQQQTGSWMQTYHDDSTQQQKHQKSQKQLPTSTDGETPTPMIQYSWSDAGVSEQQQLPRNLETGVIAKVIMGPMWCAAATLFSISNQQQHQQKQQSSNWKIPFHSLGDHQGVTQDSNQHPQQQQQQQHYSMNSVASVSTGSIIGPPSSSFTMKTNSQIPDKKYSTDSLPNNHTWQPLSPEASMLGSSGYSYQSGISHQQHQRVPVQQHHQQQPHQQQQQHYQRMMLHPQITIPIGHLQASMQHNMVHLPQLYTQMHQPQQPQQQHQPYSSHVGSNSGLQLLESDCFGRISHISNKPMYLNNFNSNNDSSASVLSSSLVSLAGMTHGSDSSSGGAGSCLPAIIGSGPAPVSSASSGGSNTGSRTESGSNTNNNLSMHPYAQYNLHQYHQFPQHNHHQHQQQLQNQQQHNVFKSNLDKSQRACCFYMRGGCKKEDCEYAHDLSKVTCKFWEKGDCFKADTCPFKHGYPKE